jgi:hypothetical protein
LEDGRGAGDWGRRGGKRLGTGGHLGFSPGPKERRMKTTRTSARCCLSLEGPPVLWPSRHAPTMRSSW